jgi:acetyltransferase-like isoleucine patch superfamily enzyme
LFKDILLTAHFRLLRWSHSTSQLSGRYPRLVTGGNVRIGHQLCLRGAQGRVELGAVPGGELVIGDRVFVNWGSTIVATIGIEIGDDCNIAELTAIWDSNYHPLEQGAEIKQAKTIVGRNVWIGRGSMILPGVQIGDNAVIAAGSVVTTNVDSNTLVAGNPARAIRTFRAEPNWRRM